MAVIIQGKQVTKEDMFIMPIVTAEDGRKIKVSKWEPCVRVDGLLTVKLEGTILRADNGE